MTLFRIKDKLTAQKAEAQAQKNKELEESSAINHEQADLERRAKKEVEEAIKRILLKTCNKKLRSLDAQLQKVIDDKSRTAIVQAANDYDQGISGEEIIDVVIQEIKIHKKRF